MQQPVPPQPHKRRGLRWWQIGLLLLGLLLVYGLVQSANNARRGVTSDQALATSQAGLATSTAHLGNVSATSSADLATSAANLGAAVSGATPIPSATP